MNVVTYIRTLLTISLLAFATNTSFAATGDVTWQGWKFSYSTNTGNGLELQDVYFNDRKILHRASFPVMRVEYDNDVCGPYADILWMDNYQPIDISPPYDGCNGSELCGRSYTQGEAEFFELGLNAKLGEYEIYQSYVFNPEGYFDSHLFSRGLQCVADHRHHAHWLFDFDIDGKANDQILKNRGNLQTSEFNDRKTDTSYWTIRDAETGLRVEVVPGQTDGFTDDFSQWDVAARKWKSGETENWRLGARGDIGNFYNNSDSIDREDIVFWYVSHLDHKALEGSIKWHASGPRIVVVIPDQ